MLTKKAQTSSKRLKPKAVKDKRYLYWLHNQSDIFCFVCGKQNKLECHHIKEFSSDKKDDRKILMLCGEECHRNGTGLSAHGTPKKFRNTFSMKTQLSYSCELYDRYLSEKVV